MSARPPVLWPVLLVASISGTVVAVVAIYASYSHMHDLVLLAGEDEDLARIVPASIDGLVFFAAAVMWAQHKTGEKVHRMAPAALWLAGGASLGANVISKWPDVATSWLARLAVAAWPAIAVIVMGHLAVQLIGLVLRERRPAPPARTAARPGRAAPADTGQRSGDAPAAKTAATKPPRAPAARQTDRRQVTDDELMDRAREEADRLDQTGKELSRAVLREAIYAAGGQVSTHRAAATVRAVKVERAAKGNGAGTA